MKKIIFWGVISTCIGALGWVTSVIFAVLTGGHHFVFISNVFGILFFVSIPATIVAAVVKKIHTNKRK